MSGYATGRGRRPSRLSVATFVLSALLTATMVNVVRLWDTSPLLPHQEGLWLAIHGAMGLSLVLTVVSLLAMLASRPAKRPAPKPGGVSVLGPEGTLV